MAGQHLSQIEVNTSMVPFCPCIYVFYDPPCPVFGFHFVPFYLPFSIEFFSQFFVSFFFNWFEFVVYRCRIFQARRCAVMISAMTMIAFVKTVQYDLEVLNVMLLYGLCYVLMFCSKTKACIQNGAAYSSWLLTTVDRKRLFHYLNPSKFGISQRFIERFCCYIVDMGFEPETYMQFDA